MKAKRIDRMERSLAMECERNGGDQGGGENPSQTEKPADDVTGTTSDAHCTKPQAVQSEPEQDKPDAVRPARGQPGTAESLDSRSPERRALLNRELINKYRSAPAELDKGGENA